MRVYTWGRNFSALDKKGGESEEHLVMCFHSVREAAARQFSFYLFANVIKR